MILKCSAFLHWTAFFSIPRLFLHGQICLTGGHTWKTYVHKHKHMMDHWIFLCTGSYRTRRALELKSGSKPVQSSLVSPLLLSQLHRILSVVATINWNAVVVFLKFSSHPACEKSIRCLGIKITNDIEDLARVTCSLAIVHANKCFGFPCSVGIFHRATFFLQHLFSFYISTSTLNPSRAPNAPAQQNRLSQSRISPTGSRTFLRL